MIENMEKIEARFTKGFNGSTRELRFSMDHRNRVFWYEYPFGEIGETRPFSTVLEAHAFLIREAVRKGYPMVNHLSRPAWMQRDLQRLHKEGRYPRWASVPGASKVGAF